MSFKALLKYILPFVLGLLVLPIPLLRDFHFETAMIAGTIGAIWAAFKLLKSTYVQDKTSIPPIIRFVYIFGLPSFLFSLISGCLTWQGVFFWILTPIPSIFFGAALGRFVRSLNSSFPKTLTFIALVLFAFGGLLLEAINFPQVYFFNHIWGTWPGPIYDETVTVTKSYVYFRCITALWILFLWNLPRITRRRINQLLAGFFGTCLIVCYFYLSQMGIITPRSVLKEELSTHITTTHFDLYFDSNNFSDAEIEYWALKHEFYFNQITAALEIEWPSNRRIESYLYANAWQKKELVGAKYTSYVPIWLSQDQLHIAKQQLDGVLKHEMVHAISKQFGNSLFNGSWSIGLIEGVAEAIAADASRESTLAQIIASEQPYPSVQQMRNAFSSTGFYSSAASISYTTAGAFVQYLLQNYPVQNFKQAYPNSDFEQAYGIPFDSLVIAWEKTLPPVVIDSIDIQNSEFLFGQLSLFQKSCPHSVSKELHLWDQYQFHNSVEETASAQKAISDLYSLDIENLLVKREWISSQLSNGGYITVIEAITANDTLLTLKLLKADALVLNGDIEAATQSLNSLKQNLTEQTGRSFRYSYALRSDSTNWTHFLAARYQKNLPSVEKFNTLNVPNQMLIISEAIDTKNYALLPQYSHSTLQHPLNSDWFDVYEALIDRLIFLKSFDEAQQWLDKLSNIELRARYQERLSQQKDWLYFMKSY